MKWMESAVQGTDIHVTALESTKGSVLLDTAETTAMDAKNAPTTLRIATAEESFSPSFGPMVPFMSEPISGMSGINHIIVDIVVVTLSIR